MILHFPLYIVPVFSFPSPSPYPRFTKISIPTPSLQHSQTSSWEPRYVNRQTGYVQGTSATVQRTSPSLFIETLKWLSLSLLTKSEAMLITFYYYCIIDRFIITESKRIYFQTTVLDQYWKVVTLYETILEKLIKNYIIPIFEDDLEVSSVIESRNLISH